MGDHRRQALAALVLLLAALTAGRAAEEGPEAAAAPAADSGVATAEPEAEGGEDAPEPPPPLWMETYSEGVYSKHEEDNAAGFTDVKLGKRFHAGIPVDLYAKARMHRDARDFFWNNHLDAGAGVRANLIPQGAALAVFAEALTGYYYRTSAGVGNLAGLQARLDRARASLDAMQSRFQGVQLSVFRRAALGDTVFTQKALDSLDAVLTAQGLTLSGLDAYLDSVESTRDSLRQVGDSLAAIPAGPLTEYRAGFVFWYGRGQEPAEGPRLAFPFRFWCDVYADGIFSALSRTVQSRQADDTYKDSTASFNNFIFYANPDVGLVLMDGPGGSLAAYATAYAWFDTHGDWWNNRAMAGPGLRHKPFQAFDLVFAFEYLWGAYYGRERKEDPNPYARTFQDLRLQASFWYGLGF